jgi:hypothetical protein
VSGTGRGFESALLQKHKRYGQLGALRGQDVFDVKNFRSTKRKHGRWAFRLTTENKRTSLTIPSQIAIKKQILATISSLTILLDTKSL